MEIMDTKEAYLEEEDYREQDKHLTEALTESTVFKEFEQSFTEATGMPLALRPKECWQLPLHGKDNESPFCNMMANTSKTCACCLQHQQKIIDACEVAPVTLECPHGLSDTAVPVKLGKRTIAFLQTGHVFQKKPSKTQFNHMLKQMGGWGLKFDKESLSEAYYDTKVIEKKQYEAMITMMKIFGEYLSLLSNQIAVRQNNAEPVFIVKAKQFITERYSESLSLEQVAKAVNTSLFYFCKMFKRITGLNFTEYVSRVRIERAKNLLLNPNLRISEIAFEVGFQSLTHFNRVFRKMVGQSPTDYRGKLPTN